MRRERKESVVRVARDAVRALLWATCGIHGAALVRLLLKMTAIHITSSTHKLWLYHPFVLSISPSPLRSAYEAERVVNNEHPFSIVDSWFCVCASAVFLPPPAHELVYKRHPLTTQAVVQSVVVLPCCSREVTE